MLCRLGSGRYRPRPIGYRVIRRSGSWSGQRLYLFYSEQTRAAFLANPGRIIDTAERKWPDSVRSWDSDRILAQNLTDAALSLSPQAIKAGTRKFSVARP